MASKSIPSATPTFIANFPKVFKKEFNKLKKKDEYSVVAIFPEGTDISRMKADAMKAGVEAWGEDQTKWPKPSAGKTFGSPFRKGSEKQKTDEKSGKDFIPEPYTAGCTWMTLSTERQPGVVDQNVQPILNEQEIYSGVKLQATINFFAYKHESGTVGIGVGLRNIQKVADGTPLGGGTRAEQDFAPIALPAGDSAAAAAGAASLFG